VLSGRYLEYVLTNFRLYNGGGPGVLYGLLASIFFYSTIAASLAELASALPSSANVYHWSSVTAGRYGKIVSFYAGWWNCLVRVQTTLRHREHYR